MSSTTCDKQPPVQMADDGVDMRMELIISNVLQFGVIISMSIILLGTILTFVHHPDYVRSADLLPRLITPDRAEFPHSVVAVLDGLAAVYRAGPWSYLGLFLLIATPVLRVGVSILVFLLMRDWIFASITTVVLCFLILSFLLGHAH